MNELKKAGVKSKVEAVLFSVGHKISLEEISKLCRSGKEEVLAALKELQQEYEAKQSSLMLVEEGESWKFSVRDHFIPMVRKIVTETELTRTVLETLAVIAFKYPILQSDLIKIRTNKAYDHLMELEKAGYISRQKHSRTNLIKLTDKFFKYFDLTEDKLKDQFKDFESIARAIKDKEEEVEKIKEGQRQRAEDLKKEDEKIKKQIDELDKSDEEFSIPLEQYKPNVKEKISQDNLIKEILPHDEKLGNLEITEVPKQDTSLMKQPTHEITIQSDAKKEEQLHQIKQIKEIPSKKRRKKGIVLTPEMEKQVDEKVQKMLQGEKEDTL